MALVRARMLKRSKMGGTGVEGFSIERIFCDTGTVTPHRNDRVYYMRNIPNAHHPKNSATFILKGDENKKQLKNIDPNMAERGGNLLQKNCPQGTTVGKTS